LVWQWLVKIDGPPTASGPISLPSADATELRRNRVSWGNHVETLLDCDEYFRRWVTAAGSLTRGDQIVHAAWRLQDVHVDARAGGPRLLDVMRDVWQGGVTLRLRLSTHARGIANLAGWARFRTACHLERDVTMPLMASNHEKMTVFSGGDGGDRREGLALVGSADLARTYWDRASHLPHDHERYNARKPAHEAGLQITGPAAEDLLAVFRRQPPSMEGFADQSDRGPMQSVVQIVRTVPSWCEHEPAEFSLWNAWTNAVERSQKYIYIEDQYFWPDFGRLVPPSANPLRLLASALCRGVDVVIVIPMPHRPRQHALRFARRHAALESLRRTARDTTGRLVISTLSTQGVPIHVHSKVLLCDDTYVLMGTGNVNRRSMFFDREVAVGIADASIAESVRARLWGEHLEASPSDLADATDGIERFVKEGGRVRRYPDLAPTRAFGSRLNQLIWDRLVDPPARLT
jgi:phosphatidylserine/phosphatidylglycerophosphate/cardiolipin synthase-like enzyme